MMSHVNVGRWLGVILATASMGALVVPSVAQEQASKRVRKACAADARRLCPREKGDTPEMRYCMEAKGRQLSRDCIRALEDDGTIPRGYFGKT